ncbi:MAG: septum formation initiator family protein [Clostridiales bacterium]|jgi:cell division protein DivIC|nr:septum formation initiator family protein [Clostridiales bacterium]
MGRKSKNKTGLGIIAFVVLILFGIIAYSGIELKAKNETARLRIEKLQSQIAEQEERAAEIKRQEAYFQTRKYIEETARERLGLVYEDEILLKPEE